MSSEHCELDLPSLPPTLIGTRVEGSHKNDLLGTVLRINEILQFVVPGKRGNYSADWTGLALSACSSPGLDDTRARVALHIQVRIVEPQKIDRR